MEAEEDAVGDGEVEERMVVKELVVVHQADQALPHGSEPLHCSPAPELDQRAHILGSVGGRHVGEVRDDAGETCYDVGKGASPNMGSSNCGSSVQGCPRE